MHLHTHTHPLIHTPDCVCAHPRAQVNGVFHGTGDPGTPTLFALVRHADGKLEAISVDGQHRSFCYLAVQLGLAYIVVHILADKKDGKNFRVNLTGSHPLSTGEMEAVNEFYDGDVFDLETGLLMMGADTDKFIQASQFAVHWSHMLKATVTKATAPPVVNGEEDDHENPSPPGKKKKAAQLPTDLKHKVIIGEVSEWLRDESNQTRRQDVQRLVVSLLGGRADMYHANVRAAAAGALKCPNAENNGQVSVDVFRLPADNCQVALDALAAGDVAVGMTIDTWPLNRFDGPFMFPFMRASSAEAVAAVAEFTQRGEGMGETHTKATRLTARLNVAEAFLAAVIREVRPCRDKWFQGTGNISDAITMGGGTVPVCAVSVAKLGTLSKRVADCNAYKLPIEVRKRCRFARTPTPRLFVYWPYLNLCVCESIWPRAAASCNKHETKPSTPARPPARAVHG